MSDPATSIHDARSELDRVATVPLSNIPSQAAKDLYLAAFLLASARRKCGLKDVPETKKAKPAAKDK